MCRKLVIMLLSLSGLLAAAFTASAKPGNTDSVFVSSDLPHATIERLDQKDIRDDVYPVLLVRVDGKPVSDTARKYVKVKPGKHVLRIKPDLKSVHEYQPNSGRNQPPPQMNLQETDLTVDMQEGYVYKIAVRRQGTSWTHFTPFVLKSWPAKSGEPDATD